MRIALGSDHAGFELKEVIKQHLVDAGYEVDDFGTFDSASVDYPDYAYYVGRAVVNGRCPFGILVCGTGIGMSITANKIPGIRAAVCSDAFSAEATRLHNDANVLALGARVITKEKALQLVDIFLNTSFEGGRHEKRVNKIKNIEDMSAVEHAEQLANLVKDKEEDK